MVRLKDSRFNVIVPLKDKRALVYNSLSGAMALWSTQDSGVYEHICNGDEVDKDDPVVNPFLNGGFCVGENVDELGELMRQYRMHRYDENSMTLTISPTMDCNFACDYCFQKNERSSEVMGMEVQEGILNLITRAAHRIKHLNVTWYGGEPLLQVPVVINLSEKILTICRTYRIRYESMLVTNGYGLTAEVAGKLHILGVKTIQVTLDGPREYHDKRRVLKSGKPTFDRIVANLKEVVKVFPGKINIRVNLDFRNSDVIQILLTQLKDLSLAHINNLKIYYAPIEAITEFCHNIAETSITKSEYGRLEADLISKTYQQGLTGLPYPPRFRGSCAAIRPLGFVINPNGDMYKCWDTVSRPDRKIGTIFDVDAIKLDNTYKRWLQWNPFENPTCLSCKILPSCAGACAFKFLYKEDTLGEAAEIPCISWRYSIKERLVLKAIGDGFLTPEDYDPDAIKTNPREIAL